MVGRGIGFKLCAMTGFCQVVCCPALQCRAPFNISVRIFMRLLLLEDSSRLRDLLGETLREAGYSLEVIASASAFQKAIDDVRYDLQSNSETRCLTPRGTRARTGREPAS